MKNQSLIISRAKETEQQSANASAAVKRRLQGKWIDFYS